MNTITIILLAMTIIFAIVFAREFVNWITDGKDESDAAFVGESFTHSEIKSTDNKAEFIYAYRRWLQASKQIPQCDHRAQKPTGSQFGIPQAAAEVIAREIERDFNR